MLPRPLALRIPLSGGDAAPLFCCQTGGSRPRLLHPPGTQVHAPVSGMLVLEVLLCCPRPRTLRVCAAYALPWQ